MAWIDWSIVGLYVVSAIAIGAWFTRKASKGTTDFFVAGRSLGWFVAGTSIVATTFAADTPVFVSAMSETKALLQTGSGGAFSLAKSLQRRSLQGFGEEQK